MLDNKNNLLSIILCHIFVTEKTHTLTLLFKTKTMKIFKFFLTLFVLVATIFTDSATPTEIVVHSGNYNGHELVYLDPPQVTYDDELNELTVYFGSSGTIDLECDDGLGTPYYFIYGDYHYGNTSTTYYYLPAGYYTVTIHSIYGVDYYGNFTVYY